ncbi:AAA family ATPase [Larkinella rosea]|uniref:AAA family ATPase n=1 Tax=Larkinella rosea TaxID=2025312 RepID=A0A3P1BDH7_9BACT|nr:AAA family ATPase [Larkinella rosea]RRA99187.1 AAA family ATPase [Larkinella rosea]
MSWKLPADLFKFSPDDDDFPNVYYFVQQFGVFPNQLICRSQFELTLPDFLIQQQFVKVHERTELFTKQEEHSFWSHPEGILFRLHYLPAMKAYSVVGGYSSRDVLDRVLTGLNAYKIPDPDSSMGKVGLITQQYNELVVEETQLKLLPLELEKHYNDDLLPVYDKLIDRLNTNGEKGLIILHGKPGTGKTNLIRHLTTQLSKQVLVLPPQLVEVMTQPGFIPFLLEQRNSILVIEEAEQVLMDRETDVRNAAVSNLLNLTDGLLADCLAIQILCTFNTDIKRLDPALLRKGRLIARYEFGELAAEKANRLLNERQLEFRTDKPMTLADIYHLEEEVHFAKKENRTIGF